MARPWQNADVMDRLYNEKKMSQPQIAEELGCSRWTVRKWMDRHNIETRDSLEARLIWHRKNPDVHVRTDHNGYRRVEHEISDDSYYAYLHRLLAVAEHGFDAVAESQVHHKNHISWDNRPENIELVGASEHQTHHLNVQYGNKQMPSE